MRTLRQSLPVPVAQKPPSRSQTYTQRLRNLAQAFTLIRMTVPPDRSTLQLLDDVLPGLWAGFIRKFIPQIFHQLKAFKFAKMFDGLKC